MRNVLVFLALTTSALLACGGSQPAANPPAPAPDRSGAGLPGTRAR